MIPTKRTILSRQNVRSKLRYTHLARGTIYRVSRLVFADPVSHQ